MRLRKSLGLLVLLPVFVLGGRPVLVEEPVDISVNRGEPATLNCAASGDPEPIISWFKDGEPLNLDEGDHTMLIPGGSLFFLRTVQNSRTQDSGLYSCRAENRDGSVESRKARLTVKYMKSKFGEVTRSLEAVEGEILRVSCRPPEGSPRPRVYWEKDGLTLVNDDYFIVEEGGDLLIAEAGVEDTGSYVCLASSADITRRDAAIRVHVSRKAVVITETVAHEIPTIAESYMLDSVTGLVAWNSVNSDYVTGYTVLLTANDQQVTNITVEDSVSQIKLHSLDPTLIYSVQVAAVYNDKVGEYSAASQLTLRTHEVVLVNNEEIPIKIWAIAMAIVIIVTLTIVMAAALLCYKTKKFRSSSRHSNVCSEYGRTLPVGGWDSRRWDENSPTTSYRSQNRLLRGPNGLYEYAVPSCGGPGVNGNANLVQYQYSSGNGGGSNHYASNTILKPAYYEPLNLKHIDTSNSSFESEYKTPLDVGQNR